MNLPEALAAALDGAAVRRSAWPARRLLRVLAPPWAEDGAERLVLVDFAGQLQPVPYFARGDDLRALDWETAAHADPAPG